MGDDERAWLLGQLADYEPMVGRVDPATMVLRAKRILADRRLYYVTFDNDAGQPGSRLIGATANEAGEWQCTGGAGGSGLAPDERLWVNLAGWWGSVDTTSPGQLWAGGEVLGPGAADVRRVRLSFPSGVTIEDEPTAGVVLFLADGVGQLSEATVELRDAQGRIVAEHPVL